MKERERWDDYMEAYEDMIRQTATRHAPWIVVPADSKRFARIVVAAAVVDALESLNLTFPAIGPARKKELRRRPGGPRGRGVKSSLTS